MPSIRHEPTQHTAYIHTHERSIREMAEEGLDLPAEATLLAYRDTRKNQHQTILLPSRSAALARAARLVEHRQTRRADVRLLSLEEALS
ncbi:MAG: hypothetical protein O2807_06165 [bacterium]|nr:hypothetical protein [bacterium]